MATIGKGEKKEYMDSYRWGVRGWNRRQPQPRVLLPLIFFCFFLKHSKATGDPSNRENTRCDVVWFSAKVQCVCAIHKTKIQTDLQLGHYYPALCSHLLIFKMSRLFFFSDQPKVFMCNPLSAINPVWVTPTVLCPCHHSLEWLSSFAIAPN